MVSRAGVLAFVVVGLLFEAAASRAAVPAPIMLPFDASTDTLCFFNGDPDLDQFGWLGQWGHSHGICQGIAGMAAAFSKNAVFDPSGPKPKTEKEARRLIAKAVRLNKGACPQRAVIPGYANLQEFCGEYRREFLRDSMWYNASIAVVEILPTLPLFLSRKNSPLRCHHDRIRLKRTLDSFYRGLSKGAPQLLQHYSHVVMVYGMRYETDETGRPLRAVLTVYNSNVANPEEWSYPLGPDGLPAMSNELVWNVTPHRLKWRCH